jgi:NitT/TauT family transport system substrate-binding protein
MKDRQMLVAALILLIMIIGGCKAKPGKQDSVDFLTLKGPSAMGMIYLLDSQATAIPTKLKIEILDEPMMVRSRMLKDKPELAVLPLNMGAILYNMGLPYQVIAIPVWGTLYLLGSDTTVSDWQSLKNKRIFLMGKGTTPDILFRYLLDFHKLSADKDVILDYSFPTHIDLANAVTAGKAGLALISEPLVTLAQARNPLVRQFMDLNSEWSQAFPGNQMPQTALLGRTDFIMDHPDWVISLCEAWIRSINQVNKYPEEAAERIVFHKILPDSGMAVKSIPGCNLKFRYASDIRPAIGQFLQVFLTFNPDAIGGKLPDEKFIYQKPDN